MWIIKAVYLLAYLVEKQIKPWSKVCISRTAQNDCYRFVQEWFEVFLLTINAALQERFNIQCLISCLSKLDMKSKLALFTFWIHVSGLIVNHSLVISLWHHAILFIIKQILTDNICVCCLCSVLCSLSSSAAGVAAEFPRSASRAGQSLEEQKSSFVHKRVVFTRFYTKLYIFKGHNTQKSSWM